LKPLEFGYDLSSEEEAEIEKYESPYFHDEERCGVLTKKEQNRPHAFITRYYCETHGVLVSISGWEVGKAYGAVSKELNPHNEVENGKEI
jgi:hypothetical protein